MGATSKIALGVAGGYLLGRTKKLKLALTLGGLLAGKRLAGGPGGLLGQGSDLLGKSPELARLQKDSGDLVDAAKAAALTSATQRLHSLGDTLRGHPLDSAGQLTPQSSQGSDQDSTEADDQSSDDQSSDDQSGQSSQESEEASPTSKKPEKRPDQSARKRTQQTAKKTASRGSSGARSASKKTAKKTAKKSAGANRSSSGR